jgi:hypothetical protein
MVGITLIWFECVALLIWDFSFAVMPKHYQPTIWALNIRPKKHLRAKVGLTSNLINLKKCDSLISKHNGEIWDNIMHEV